MDGVQSILVLHDLYSVLLVLCFFCPTNPQTIMRYALYSHLTDRQMSFIIHALFSFIEGSVWPPCNIAIRDVVVNQMATSFALFRQRSGPLCSDRAAGADSWRVTPLSDRYFIQGAKYFAQNPQDIVSEARGHHIHL